MNREELLDKAKKIVAGNRQDMYGNPEDNFVFIAELWSRYLKTDIGAADVAIMMILMKITRLAASCYDSADSWIDIAGYAACGAECCVFSKKED